MSKQFNYEITLVLRGPLITQTSGSLAFGVDAAQLRDADNVPVLPGTLLRGNLLHAWTAFDKMNSGPGKGAMLRWLGEPSRANEHDLPRRGKVHFDRYWHTDKPMGRAKPRYRIAIDPATGAVKRGAYQVVETPFSSGHEYRFTGGVHAYLKDEAESDALLKWLHKGLAFIPSLGALKGVGFGELIGYQISPRSAKHDSSDSSRKPSQKRTRLLRIQPESPFCFARHRPGNNETFNQSAASASSGLSNTYVSESFIPGGAIKAALAARVREAAGLEDLAAPLSAAVADFPLLTRHLDDIRVNHGYPAEKGSRQRPVPMPFTLATFPGRDEIRVQDLALHLNEETAAVLLDGKAPRFATDWKASHEEAACEKFGSIAKEPKRVLELRTAIDNNTNAADEGQLFSIESVDPDGVDWLSSLSLPPNLTPQETESLWGELDQLLASGLSDLGKTKARADAALMDAPTNRDDETVFIDGRAVVVLASMARLLSRDDTPLPGANGGSQLGELYQAAWNSLSNGALELVAFFAQQTLLGGAYWWRRFRKSQPPYNPELMTLPGSVFVLRAVPGREEEAAILLRQWDVEGLPQLKDATGGEDWRRNPYIAANGYGEILLNHPVHWQKPAPAAQLVKISQDGGIRHD